MQRSRSIVGAVWVAAVALGCLATPGLGLAQDAPAEGTQPPADGGEPAGEAPATDAPAKPAEAAGRPEMPEPGTEVETNVSVIVDDREAELQAVHVDLLRPPADDVVLELEAALWPPRRPGAGVDSGADA